MFVKRLLVIPLMFLYLLAVSGVMIHAHYCGDNLESWTINTKTTDGCADGACGDESQQSDGCCKDKVISAKVAVDHYVADAFKVKLFNPDMALTGIPDYISTEHFYSPFYLQTRANRSNAPPGLWQRIPLYRLYTRFTYYG